MNRRVNFSSGKVKLHMERSRSESESEQGDKLLELDPKPGELSMVRVKVVERRLEARTFQRCKVAG
jgi:hypothetical protein